MQKELKITRQDKEALATVKVLLESNIDSAPSQKMLCKKSGLNANKLKKGFKILYGYPPYAFHVRLKMQEAQRLLQETEQPIIDIAWTIGYQRVSAFCKAFKKYSGMTALEWRLK